ncbi:Extracellular Matrix protein PelE [Labilithrix luteola]|uniref:Extracellular Matrix protein PelE n=1 Tax=Labilithrix luteola TaxID=1391654 RepID=A0A0K1PJP0_9BACT|nr:Extracellular Matrix protein PelE [Labilithrix luteola]
MGAIAVGAFASVDLALFVVALVPRGLPLTTTGMLLAFLGIHVCCSLGAGVMLAGDPPSFLRHKWIEVTIFGAIVAFFVPVVGPVGMLLVFGLGFTEPRPVGSEPWLAVETQEELDAQLRSGVRGRKRRASVYEIGAMLRERTKETEAARFEAILATRGLPDRVAVPLLKSALSDPSDEIRLYAFSRLERMRDEIERRIAQVTRAIEGAEEEEMPRLHLRLAECHWELAFAGLAEGIVLTQSLASAQHHASTACELLPGHAAAEFFLGRIFVRMRDVENAVAAFARAMEAGYPRVKLLPYLAECAFYRRDYVSVRGLLRELEMFAPDNSFSRPVLEFWDDLLGQSTLPPLQSEPPAVLIPSSPPPKELAR